MDGWIPSSVAASGVWHQCKYDRCWLHLSRYLSPRANIYRVTLKQYSTHASRLKRLRDWNRFCGSPQIEFDMAPIFIFLFLLSGVPLLMAEEATKSKSNKEIHRQFTNGIEEMLWRTFMRNVIDISKDYISGYNYSDVGLLLVKDVYMEGERERTPFIYYQDSNACAGDASAETPISDVTLVCDRDKLWDLPKNWPRLSINLEVPLYSRLTALWKDFKKVFPVYQLHTMLLLLPCQNCVEEILEMFGKESHELKIFGYKTLNSSGKRNADDIYDMATRFNQANIATTLVPRCSDADTCHDSLQHCLLRTLRFEGLCSTNMRKTVTIFINKLMPVLLQNAAYDWVNNVTMWFLNEVGNECISGRKENPCTTKYVMSVTLRKEVEQCLRSPVVISKPLNYEAPADQKDIFDFKAGALESWSSQVNTWESCSGGTLGTLCSHRDDERFSALKKATKSSCIEYRGYIYADTEDGSWDYCCRGPCENDICWVGNSYRKCN